MVYCTNCGTENDDDAVNCTNCGVNLNPPAYRSRSRRFDDNDWCFGSKGGQTWPIIFGIFIILVGASQLLDDMFWWASWDNLWPAFIIIIGLLIVINNLQRR